MNATTLSLALPAQAAPEVPAVLNARRLIWLRMMAVPGAALCLLLARQIYSLPLPALQLTLIIIGLTAFNLWVWQRLKRPQPISDREFSVQLLVDLAALTSILYYSGGASNPFVFFFMLPMAISAAALPQRYTWAIAGASACCYTLLLVMRVNVQAFHHLTSQAAMDLHSTGMWIGFVAVAGLIAYFVSGMSQTVRERDRYLARLREQALRDERVLAVATLAAGAAHELSTPLATMAVVTGEIAADYPKEHYPGLHRELGILRDQIARCKEALSVISASAGATRAESAHSLPLDVFVAHAVEEVRRLRPGCSVTIEPPPGLAPEPAIAIDRTVKQALLNVLHNAVDVSPLAVRVTYGWDRDSIRFEVIDRGGGFGTREPGSLERLGVSTKEGGLGLGLFLSHAAVSQAGGRLQAGDNDEGGTTVQMTIPLMKPLENAA